MASRLIFLRHSRLMRWGDRVPKVYPLLDMWGQARGRVIGKTVAVNPEVTTRTFVLK